MKNLYRSTLKSGSIMTGYYRYADAFQIISNNKNDSLYIEYNESYAVAKNTEAQDHPEDFSERSRMRELGHLDFLKELISLLAIVTNQYYELDFNKELEVRPSQQEIIDEFSDTSLQHEIRRDSNRVLQRQNFTLSFVSIHPAADKFFENYFKLDFEARLRYNASIILYQSMRKILLTSASMGIIGLISSIENLMEFESKKSGTKRKQCPECNQPIYSISKRFKEFMLEFSEFDVEKDSKSLLNKFYKQRSSISHAGDILEIDRLLSKFNMKEHREFTEIESHVRIALFNYLLRYKFTAPINAPV